MLTPGSTEQVAAAVRVCAKHGLAITPQGGNTGLVGGQIPQGEVLLSLKRMRAVRRIEPLEDVMVVEAGLTLLSGLDLLVHQARHQVRLFTGMDVPVEVLMSAVRAELERRGAA